MNNSITIPTNEEMEANTKQDIKDSQEASDFVESLVVSTNEDMHSAVAILKEIKNKHKEVELKRVNLTKPLNDVTKELNNNFQPALKRLKNAENSIKKKLVDCVEMRLDARESILNAIEKAPENKREDMLVRADELNPPQIEGLSIYYKETGEIEDHRVLLDWILETGRMGLLDINTSHPIFKEDIEIPGWKKVKNPVVRIDTK